VSAAYYGYRKQVRNELQSKNKVLSGRGKGHVRGRHLQNKLCTKSWSPAAAALAKHKVAAVSWQHEPVWKN